MVAVSSYPRHILESSIQGTPKEIPGIMKDYNVSIVVDGETLGKVHYTVYPVSHEMKIHWTSVNWLYQKRGIGRFLVEKMIQEARDQGVRIIYLEAALGAVEFWNRLGFVTYGTSTWPTSMKMVI